MIKKYNQYIKENDESRYTENIDYIWIYGVPSGEAIRISEDTLDDFIDKKIVDFTMKYDTKGDYIFDDSKLNIIKSYLIDNEYKISIKSYDHDFSKILMDKIKMIIKKVNGDKTIFLQDNYMGITFDFHDIYIEILSSDNTYKMPSKYKLTTRKNKSIVNVYNINNEDSLLNKLKTELKDFIF